MSDRLSGPNVLQICLHRYNLVLVSEPLAVH